MRDVGEEGGCDSEEGDSDDNRGDGDGDGGGGDSEVVEGDCEGGDGGGEEGEGDCGAGDGDGEVVEGDDDIDCEEGDGGGESGGGDGDGDGEGEVVEGDGDNVGSDVVVEVEEVTNSDVERVSVRDGMGASGEGEAECDSVYSTTGDGVSPMSTLDVVVTGTDTGTVNTGFIVVDEESSLDALDSVSIATEDDSRSVNKLDVASNGNIVEGACVSSLDEDVMTTV